MALGSKLNLGVQGQAASITNGSGVLAAQAVGSSELASNAVVGSIIASGVIVNSHIADGTIASGKLAFTPLTSGGLIFSELLSTVTGTASFVTFANTPLASKVSLYYNGAQIKTTDFTLSGATATLTFALGASDFMNANYLK